MSLNEINLNNVYRNSTNEIINDLVIPLLKESKSYYRGVGFFTSSWIKLVTSGIESIVNNDGKIYLITSPKLSEDDWNAVMIGNKAKKDDVLYQSIKNTINSFDINTKHESLNMFSWLIADGILNLKFAMCKNNKGMYHDKLAIFEDEHKNRICLHGSFNDSLQATYNGESFSVFRSWEDGQNEYVNDHFEEFKSMWNNNNSFYDVVDIPETISREIQKYQSSTRPYKLNKGNEKKIHLPSYIKDLKEYQNEAIQALIDNNWVGILEMATGTGKTITSLAATLKYFEENQRIFLVVVVPFNHLVTQWEDNIISFGYKVPISCNNSKLRWYNQLLRKIRSFNSRLSNIECLVTTYTTFSTDTFQDLISKINGNKVLIADECHYAGSSALRYKIGDDYSVKIGLSATPDRWHDEEGTKYIRDYFDSTVYEYSMENAIKNGYLTEYEYDTNVVKLTDTEYNQYKELTSKIIKLLQKGEKIDDKSNLQRLILKRSELISKAENKIPIFMELIKEHYEIGNIKNTLVYCAKGQAKYITKQLSDSGIKAHEFTHTVSNKDREKVLKAFDRGDIEVLVAIKCLDEGVDVPSTKTAYFISSTSNPREFIQRRGRILRRHKGKHMSKVIDFIVFPPDGNQNQSIDISIIEKDMPRFAEFVKYAFNEFEAKNYMRKYLEVYNLEYLMERLPWEIYRERKDKYE